MWDHALPEILTDPALRLSGSFCVLLGQLSVYDDATWVFPVKNQCRPIHSNRIPYPCGSLE
jgi:hypothetical protein